MPAPRLLPVILLLQTFCALAGEGVITGRVTDPGGAAVAAYIRVVSHSSHAVLARTLADHSGVFRSPPLRSGSYTLTFWSPGFRRQEISGIIIRDAGITEAPLVRLPVAGCDAPWVHCNILHSGPVATESGEAERVRRGESTLGVNCGLDFDSPKQSTCLTSPKGADLMVVREGTSLYIKVAKGAALSEMNPADQSCNSAPYIRTQLDLTGLGMGNDFCIRTKQGTIAHVFFTADLDTENEDKVPISFVTRKRRPASSVRH